MAQEPERPSADWLQGGGEMGACIRANDWSKTSLGPLEFWPQNLRLTVNFCLGCDFPLCILWGPKHLQIYNDAYRRMHGRGHPSFLGKEFSECWAARWSALRESFARAFKGEACSLDNQPVILERNGIQEEAYLNYCCSPIRDEAGTVVGIICSSLESRRQAANDSPTPALGGGTEQPGHVSFADIGIELRKPLARMVSSLEESLADPEHTLPLAHRDRLELAHHQSEHLFKLLDNLQQFKDFESWRHLTREAPDAPHLAGQAPAQSPAEIVSEKGMTGHPAAESVSENGESRFRRLADSIPTLIWMSGPDKKCTWFNKPWLDFVGLTMEAAQGDFSSKHIHPDDLSATMQAYLSAFDARQSFSVEYRLKRHDGEYRWMQAQGNPAYDRDGAFTGYIGSCADITESKNYEAVLKEADLRKDEFLAMLAHELRNPLAPIRTALEVLNREGPPLPVLNSSREIIVRQVEHLSRLVDDLLDVSRITRGRISLRRERIELAQLVKLAQETTHPLIEAKHQELIVTLPPDPLYLHVDPVRLTQVITNLLSNAAKYSHRNAKIQLIVEREKSSLLLRIRDDGIGLSKEMLARVFDLFTQAKGSLDRTGGGLGIGLTLVKKLVELHGGTIKALSQGEGKGSEFIVQLPIDELPAGVKLPAAAPTPADSAKRRILVVDDKIDGANSLAMLFTLQGHEVQTAHDGPAAVATVRTFKPDIVLLDIGLPGMSGYEVAALLRKEPTRKNMLLVALTGYCQPEDRLRSKEAGFDFHLVKPASSQSLASILSLSSIKDPPPAEKKKPPSG